MLLNSFSKGSKDCSDRGFNLLVCRSQNSRDFQYSKYAKLYIVLILKLIKINYNILYSLTNLCFLKNVLAYVQCEHVQQTLTVHDLQLV